jgi:hypothetical protein
LTGLNVFISTKPAERKRWDEMAEKPFISEPVSAEKDIELVKETPEGGKVFVGRPKVSEQAAKPVAPAQNQSASGAAAKADSTKEPAAQEK